MANSLSNMTIYEYNDLREKHPDIIVGSESDHPVTLARVCVDCHGRGGFVDQRGNADECPDCGGTGYVLTEDGKAMQRFTRLFGGAE